MPVEADEEGRRSVQAEAEVPGTPPEVWEALSAGPGIALWFVPGEEEAGAAEGEGAVADGGADVEVARAGDAAVSHFGPGVESLSTVTAWEPPHRFAAEARVPLEPGGPALTTEWSVEPGTEVSSVVRVVHRWAAGDDAWDARVEEHARGWAAYFGVLRLYLAHFRGHPGAPVQLLAAAPGTAEEAWAAWTGALGVAGAAEGDAVSTPEGAPRLAGTVEWAGAGEILLRLDEPAPGIAHLAARPADGEARLSLRLYLYGENAGAAAAGAEAAWRAWTAALFAPAGAG